MRRRDVCLIASVLFLAVLCGWQRGQIRDLRSELDGWKRTQFELTRVLADIQRRLFYLYQETGMPLPGMSTGRNTVYRMNLMDRGEFGSLFLKYAEKLKLMAIMAEMQVPGKAQKKVKQPVLSGGNFPDRWPTHGTITSLFGMRKHPIYKTNRLHLGVDIANFKNTEVLAAANGTVKFAGRDGGYGNTVILDHGNGFESLYGHAEDILVSAGDIVAKGQLIASMGSTGVSTGEHLHFEVRFAGEAVDPTVFVK